MEIDGRVIRQMVLFTLIVLIVPMILFPVLLGTEFMKSSLMKASFAFTLFEFIFYGFCIYFFNRETNLPRLMLHAVICMVGRYSIGAVLGLLISAMYAMNIGVAVKFGVVSFWPSIALHLIATPFILKPLFMAQNEFNRTSPKAVQIVTETAPKKNLNEGLSSFAASTATHKKEQAKKTSDYAEFQTHQPAKPRPKHSNQNIEDGFNKAVHYIGENGSTLMAAIIDNEGLLLGSYQRAMFEAEDVAPLVLPIIQQNKATLDKLKLAIPEKTDMMFENQRLIIASEKYYTLVVISERTVDDVLNIRINQALEMIRIYTAERYSQELIGNAERIYV